MFRSETEARPHFVSLARRERREFLQVAADSESGKSTDDRTGGERLEPDFIVFRQHPDGVEPPCGPRFGAAQQRGLPPFHRQERDAVKGGESHRPTGRMRERRGENRGGEMRMHEVGLQLLHQPRQVARGQPVRDADSCRAEIRWHGNARRLPRALPPRARASRANRPREPPRRPARASGTAPARSCGS